MATQAGGSEKVERLQSSATDSKTEPWSVTDTCRFTAPMELMSTSNWPRQLRVFHLTIFPLRNKF